MTTPKRPIGRYDEPRALPRAVLVAGAAVLLLALAAGAYWAFDRSRQGVVEFGTTGYQVHGDASVTVSFEVHKARDQVAVCHAEALDRQGSIVGSADVRVTAVGTQVQASQQLATDRRAATVVVTGCLLQQAP